MGERSPSKAIPRFGFDNSQKHPFRHSLTIRDTASAYEIREIARTLTGNLYPPSHTIQNQKLPSTPLSDSPSRDTWSNPCRPSHLPIRNPIFQRTYFTSTPMRDILTGECARITRMPSTNRSRDRNSK